MKYLIIAMVILAGCATQAHESTIIKNVPLDIDYTYDDWDEGDYNG